MPIHFCIAVLALAVSLGANAIPPQVQEWIDFEVLANAISRRSNKPVVLDHLEIPLKVLGIDYTEHLDPKIAASLVFERDGQKWIRWILNPEDTKWDLELIQSFKNRGVMLERRHRFTGYQTASRSYVVEDPNTGAVFSVKSSTNHTGGIWANKKQPVGEAIDGRIISDFLTHQNKLRKFQNFRFLEEPAAVYYHPVDQAVVIRDLGTILDAKNNKTYLPGFSAMHEKVGRYLAEKNGSRDPAQYWLEHYLKPVGRTLGELAARTGLQFNSPHSQNFLIELDSDLRPTGQIILRDLSDFHLDRNFLKALEGDLAPTLLQYGQKEQIFDFIAAAFGPVHGNRAPDWFDSQVSVQWMDTFFREFEKSFTETSGYDLSPLGAKKNFRNDYFSAGYRLTASRSFKSFFDQMRKLGYVAKHSPKPFCQSLLIGNQ